MNCRLSDALFIAIGENLFESNQSAWLLPNFLLVVEMKRLKEFEIIWCREDPTCDTLLNYLRIGCLDENIRCRRGTDSAGEDNGFVSNLYPKESVINLLPSCLYESVLGSEREMRKYTSNCILLFMTTS
jgi:hypothetical protein